MQTDYILLDEIHRALAKEWSKGIKVEKSCNSEEEKKDVRNNVADAPSCYAERFINNFADAFASYAMYYSRMKIVSDILDIRQKQVDETNSRILGIQKEQRETTCLHSQSLRSYMTNNDNNEVTVNQSGIICKRMDDEGMYGDKQLRITGNTLALTDEGWKTVKLGVGESVFYITVIETGESTYKQFS